MNAEMCSKILIHYAIPSVKCSVGSGFIDPKVTASAVKAYKDKKKKMDQPPQSPDLSIIKAVWDHLDVERNNTSQHQRKSIGMPVKNPGELILRSTSGNYEKACQREFWLC